MLQMCSATLLKWGLNTLKFNVKNTNGCHLKKNQPQKCWDLKKFLNQNLGFMVCFLLRSRTWAVSYHTPFSSMNPSNFSGSFESSTGNKPCSPGAPLPALVTIWKSLFSIRPHFWPQSLPTQCPAQLECLVLRQQGHLQPHVFFWCSTPAHGKGKAGLSCDRWLNMWKAELQNIRQTAGDHKCFKSPWKSATMSFVFSRERIIRCFLPSLTPMAWHKDACWCHTRLRSGGDFAQANIVTGDNVSWFTCLLRPLSFPVPFMIFQKWEGAPVTHWNAASLRTWTTFLMGKGIGGSSALLPSFPRFFHLTPLQQQNHQRKWGNGN